MPRRSFVRTGAVVAGGAMVSGSLVPMLVRAQDGTPAPAVDLANYSPVALTATELDTLKAATDRIIPSDDLGPGASDAGVFVYIDRALAGRNAAALPLFQAGLAALAAAVPETFTAATPEKQDEILATASAGDLAGDPGGFFGTLLEFVRQGMFADPIYGGNAGFVGWDLIGYPGVKLVWTEADQALDADVAPEHTSVAAFGGTAE
jgi:gluconate 2-dehydrogenase gamma chain